MDIVEGERIACARNDTSGDAGRESDKWEHIGGKDCGHSPCKSLAGGFLPECLSDQIDDQEKSSTFSDKGKDGIGDGSVQYGVGEEKCVDDFK